MNEEILEELKILFADFNSRIKELEAPLQDTAKKNGEAKKNPSNSTPFDADMYKTIHNCTCSMQVTEAEIEAAALAVRSAVEDYAAESAYLTGDPNRFQKFLEEQAGYVLEAAAKVRTGK